jgi:protein-disulfide isomerase
MDEGNKKENIWLAVSIVIAGAIIAVAIIFTNSPGQKVDPQIAYSKFMSGVNLELDSLTTTSQVEDLSKIRTPDATDHIVGSLDAKVIIVEYSDPECPFCKVLHMTLKELTSEYGDKIAWVYRSLPLPVLHEKAALESHAAECAGELGGNEKFWEYLNAVYDTTRSNDRFDLAQLSIIAENIGLNADKLNKCISEEKYVSLLAKNIQEALDATAGRLGTPFSVVIASDGSRTAVSGAQPKENWVSLIDSILAK